MHYCLFVPFSWSVSVIFCIMCVYYILHAHLLITNEILEMFTWKTNALSVFPPLLYPSFLTFSCILFFIYGIHAYIYIYISLFILWKHAIKTIIIIYHYHYQLLDTQNFKYFKLVGSRTFQNLSRNIIYILLGICRHCKVVATRKYILSSICPIW